MKPPVKIVDIIDRKPGHHLALYYDVIVEDSEGKRFVLKAGSLHLDFKPEDK